MNKHNTLHKWLGSQVNYNLLDWYIFKSINGLTKCGFVHNTLPLVQSYCLFGSYDSGNVTIPPAS